MKITIWIDNVRKVAFWVIAGPAIVALLFWATMGPQSGNSLAVSLKKNQGGEAVLKDADLGVHCVPQLFGLRYLLLCVPSCAPPRLWARVKEMCTLGVVFASVQSKTKSCH